MTRGVLTVDTQSDGGSRSVRRPVSIGTSRLSLSDEGIGAVVGALATLAILLFAVAALLAWRRQRQFGVHRVLKCLDGPLQVATATARTSSSPSHYVASQFNGTSNGLTVAAKVRNCLSVTATSF